jgi:hypothetical protein
MSFRIRGLAPQPFSHLFGLSDADLQRVGVTRCIADRAHAYPDRVELRDAAPGESLLLLNHVHQPANNPYRASHAIFVREGAEVTYDRRDEVPEVLRIRPISLRAFDADDLMVDADLCDGSDLDGLISRLFADERISYLHAHFARRGCYAARIDRD